MPAISSANQAALEKRALMARDFLWIVARERDTTIPVADGMWSDVWNIVAEVVDPATGLNVARTFYGAGTLISISDIPLVSTVAVQTVTIRMSQVHARVESLLRGYDCKQARVEIFRGLFDPANRQMVAPAFCRFVGFVDEIEIFTPAENEDGYVEIRCTSHTQEMTRSNPATRSHEDQQLRSAGDDFFKDSATVGEQEHFWGRKGGKIDTNSGSGSSSGGRDDKTTGTTPSYM